MCTGSVAAVVSCSAIPRGDRTTRRCWSVKRSRPLLNEVLHLGVRDFRSVRGHGGGLSLSCGALEDPKG